MVEKRLECMGEACPIPLIRAKKQMADMNWEDQLIVEVDHSCAIKNIPEWARQMGYRSEVKEIGIGEWEIVIDKTRKEPSSDAK